ncbi:MAG TPA: hypothetical protein EYP24_05605 [bacterium (Candidatus Stahlbacteria)]|nr:hypothetical protein [Candidatus Stahlbacteria bacterium]
MKRKYIFLAIGVILAIALFSHFQSLSVRKIKAEKEKAELVVKIQPQGELDYIPKELIIRFSKSYPGVEGILIEEDALSSFITFEPELKGYGKWISERTFEVYFSPLPRPDQEYNVTLFRVPIITEVESIPPQEVSFKTPPFEVISASLLSLKRGEAKIAVEFNLPPDITDIEDFMKITDSKKKRVKIVNLEPDEKNPEKIIVTTPVVRAPERYLIVVKKGLRSVRVASLKKDFSFQVPIGFVTRPLTVTRHRIEEAEEGYLATFTMSAPEERRPEIVEDGLKRRIRINPPLRFRVAASGRYIYIFGDFIPEKSYEITLRTGIKTKKGSELGQDYKTRIRVPERREVLQFLYQGRYFGPAGDWRLPLKISQIDSLKLNIVYMPEENVLFWHRKDYGRKWDIRHYGEYVVENYNFPIDKQKTPQVIWIDLKEFLKRREQGVYLVEAKGMTSKKLYLSDRIAVDISDLSLVVKWFDENVYVWAFNSNNLNPEEDVRIEIRSSKNFITGFGQTDGSGFCQIPVLKKERDVYLVFAEKGNDWTYLHIPSLRLAKENYDISGEDPEIPYLAYIDPERDLYRPGEEVHFTVVVREPGTFQGVAIPVRITIRDPKGNDCLALSGNTNEFGIGEFSFPTTPASPTGKYLLQVYAGDRVLASRGIFVETFVPERMRVDLEIPAEFNIYAQFPVTIKAEYLFGAPAAGEEYRLRLEANETRFKPSGYFDYAFGMFISPRSRLPSYRSEPITGRLDSKGKATVRIKVDPAVIFQGPILFSLYATVTEGGSGRVTTRTIRKTIHQRPFYIGLKSDQKRITTDVPVEVKGVLLRPDGGFYRGRTELSYRIYRLSRSYSYHYYEDYYWDYRLQRIPVTPKRPLRAKDGSFSIDFTPKASHNDYLVEVVDDLTGTTTQLKVPGWGWWYREEEKVESPEVIPIRLDKKVYDSGELVKAEALLPFEGKILWTVELDSIYYQAVTEARSEVGRFTFHAPPGLSTVYVSALLLRSGGNYLIQRGFGLKRVRIRPRSVRLELKLEISKRIRPGEELVIRVKGQERFQGTIAVVDEGILQITNFKTPDPYEGILRDLRLLINTSESFGWVIKKFLTRTGGGLMAREEEFPQARFARIVSFWSGILTSSPDGKLTYRIRIPEYNGRLRVMVAGMNRTRLGCAEAEVLVKSDVIVSPTIPRFMHTGDRFSFPITLINTTRSQKRSRISLSVSGARLKGKKHREVRLRPEEKRLIWVECEALDLPGSIKIGIDGRTDRERYHEDFEIPLYPNIPYITESEYLSLVSGKTDLSPYLADWYPKAHQVKLILSPIPAVSRLNHLKYAIRYPYGCIEQTSTSTFLLLRLSNLLPILAPKITKEKYQDMVNSGVRRIISMQTVSGGFAFWPGGGRPAAWASGYATLVLIEAKKAGFFVPSGVIKAALNYLDALPDKSGFLYYVLARGGHLAKNPTLIDRLVNLARKDRFDIPSALWICGAINEAGRSRAAKEYLEAILKKKEPKVRRYRRDFYSHLQYQGMKLYLLQIIDPEHPEVERLLLEIGKALARKRSYYYTTQELAWCMSGIGMFAETQGDLDYRTELRYDGKRIKPEIKNGIHSFRLKNAGGHRISIRVQSERKIYLNIEQTGFSKKVRTFHRVNNGLYLDRDLYSYDGDRINSADQGELLVMKVAIKGSGWFDNVAIEAPIPAGLEIENPRLRKEDLPDWIDPRHKVFQPDYVDIRDDRVIIFGSVQTDTLYYYLLTRSVTPGKFFFPVTKGMVMYNPDINGHTSASDFEIYKR